MWLHSTANVASIITLARWRDARTEIDVLPTSHGVVLCNERARVDIATP
jgi:hypothetical protein